MLFKQIVYRVFLEKGSISVHIINLQFLYNLTEQSLNLLEKDSNIFCPRNDEEGWEGQSHTVTASNYESTAIPTHSPHHDADRKDQAKLYCLWVKNELESKEF